MKYYIGLNKPSNANSVNRDKNISLLNSIVYLTTFYIATLGTYKAGNYLIDKYFTQENDKIKIEEFEKQGNLEKIFEKNKCYSSSPNLHSFG